MSLRVIRDVFERVHPAPNFANDNSRAFLYIRFWSWLPSFANRWTRSRRRPRFAGQASATSFAAPFCRCGQACMGAQNLTIAAIPTRLKHTQLHWVSHRFIKNLCSIFLPHMAPSKIGLFLALLILLIMTYSCNFELSPVACPSE